MKKLIAIVVVIVLAVGILLSGDCHAGNEGWAAAGGFLGGLVVGSAVSSRPSYYYGRPYYYSSCYPVYSTYGYRSYYYPSYYYPSCYTYSPYYYNNSCDYYWY